MSFVIAINTIVLDTGCSQLSSTATVVSGDGVFVPRWRFVVVFSDAGQPIPKTHGSLCQREKQRNEKTYPGNINRSEKSNRFTLKIARGKYKNERSEIRMENEKNPVI